MRLLVFLHGTVLMHRGGVGRTRGERVAQVRDGSDPTVRDFRGYVPVEGVVEKLWRWREQGAEIAYLSSHRDPEDVEVDARVLREHGFPAGRVLSRAPDETYGDVVAREPPDVLIEDDCESIGAAELTYPQVAPGLRARMASIVVPEFGGLAHLPDSLGELASVDYD